MKLSEELSWRGFVNQTTFKSVDELDDSPITFYWGVDPSAASMTIGNLAAAMMVRQFMEHGHKAVLLVGGATGMIGDPDGKSDERNLMTLEQIEINKAGIAAQYERVFGGLDFKLVDNKDWFKDMGYLDFLRDVGKHVPMRQMLGRDFVQKRLSENGSGISYAEFSYVLIQAYDFLHLHQNMGVDLQICGSDQWGNSVAGVDLIRRVTGQETHVWTTPLIINKATGKKFGKSEEGAIWLDPKLTSVYKFYQFWLNLADDGIEDYIKVYTLLPKQKIDSLMADFKANPSGRLAQKTLAYEVTNLVHGAKHTEAVIKATDVLFGTGSFLNLDGDEVAVLKVELPTVPAGQSLAATLVAAGLAISASEAQRFIAAGAINVNNQKITEDHQTSLQPGANLIKRGKNNFAIAVL